MYDFNGKQRGFSVNPKNWRIYFTLVPERVDMEGSMVDRLRNTVILFKSFCGRKAELVRLFPPKGPNRVFAPIQHGFFHTTVRPRRTSPLDKSWLTFQVDYFLLLWQTACLSLC